MALRYAKWKQSPEEIQEQIRIAEEVIRPLGFPEKRKSPARKKEFIVTVEKNPSPGFSLDGPKHKKPPAPKQKIAKA